MFSFFKQENNVPEIYPSMSMKMAVTLFRIRKSEKKIEQSLEFIDSYVIVTLVNTN